MEGFERIKILEFKNDKEYLTSSIEVVSSVVEKKEELTAFALALVKKLERLSNLNKKISFELMTSLKDQDDPSRFADHISGQLNISISEKQKLLETIDFCNWAISSFPSSISPNSF